MFLTQPAGKLVSTSSDQVDDVASMANKIGTRTCSARILIPEFDGPNAHVAER